MYTETKCSFIKAKETETIYCTHLQNIKWLNKHKISKIIAVSKIIFVKGAIKKTTIVTEL